MNNMQQLPTPNFNSKVNPKNVHFSVVDSVSSQQSPETIDHTQ